MAGSECIGGVGVSGRSDIPLAVLGERGGVMVGAQLIGSAQHDLSVQRLDGHSAGDEHLRQVIEAAGAAEGIRVQIERVLLAGLEVAHARATG
mgnify:CR=1 FL=1